VGGEGARLGQRREITEEAQRALVEGAGEAFQEQAAEQPAEHLDRQEEPRGAGDPARTLG
jgi:hypothetical protein